MTRDREAVTVALRVVVAVVAVVVALAASMGGAAYFIQFGDESASLGFAREQLGEDVPTPLADEHDGEAFWLLARDPFLTAGEELADRLDRPVYRAQRIAYPLVASPWRLFGEHALTWGLVLTNVAVIGFGTWITARIAACVGLSAAWGYAFALNPLVVLSLLFDFGDALAAAGVLGAVLAVLRGRAGWAVVAAVVATLAKEPSLLALASLAVLGRGIPTRTRVALVLPAAAVAGLWRLYVLAQPGFDRAVQVGELDRVPFHGYAEAWRRSWDPYGSWSHLAVAVSVAVVAVVAVVQWWRSGRSTVLAAAVGPSLLVPFLSDHVVTLLYNSLRAVGPVATLLVVGAAAGRRAVT